MRKLLRSTALVLALLAGPLANFVVASPARAATECYGSGGLHQDYWGSTYGTRYCTAYTSGNVVAAGNVVGFLYSGDSWFVCQEKWIGFNNPPVGGAQNDWWLYTQADVGYSWQGWGWFPATKISGGNNWGPVPGLRFCGSSGYALPSP